jgi:hypothetical protein
MSAVVIIITPPPPPPPSEQQRSGSGSVDHWAQQIAAAVRGALQGLDVCVSPVVGGCIETKPAPDRL